MDDIIPNNLKIAIRALPLHIRVNAYIKYAIKYLESIGKPNTPPETFAEEIAAQNNDAVASAKLWDIAFN